MTLVLVQYEFDYTAKDGRHVSIRPNESYILVSKTNEHWWHVRRDPGSRPFYVPAQYVKDVPDVTAVTTQTSPEEACRVSTHGFCGDVPETGSPEPTGSSAPVMDKEPFHAQQNRNSELYAKIVPGIEKRGNSSTLEHESIHDEDEDFPQPPDFALLDLTPEENPIFDGPFEAPEPDFKGKQRRQAEDGGSSAAPSTEKVKLQSRFFIDFIHLFIHLGFLSSNDTSPAGVAVLPLMSETQSFKHSKLLLSFII